MHPSTEYQSRLQNWGTVLNRYQFQERLFSIARLIVFISGVILFGLSAGASLFSAVWLLIPAILFVVLVVKHDRILRLRDQASLAINFYKRGLSRIDDTWMERDDPIYEVKVDSNHLYSWDLDLFGTKSLFQLLCTARTLSGIETLAQWLLTAASREVVRDRQEAVGELRDRVILREDLAIVEVGAGLRPARQATSIDFVIRWAEQTSSRLPQAGAKIGLGLTILTLVSLIAWLVFKTGPLFFILAIFAEAIFASIFRKKIKESLIGLERAGKELRLLSGILARIEKESFESNLLRNWRAKVSAEGGIAIAPDRSIESTN